MSIVWFDMERVLRPDKTRTLLIVSFWASLGVLCLYLTHADSNGIKAAMFFGIFCILFGVKLHPRVAYLKLSQKGFEYKYYLPARFIEWNQVENFTTYRDKWGPFVGWNYSERFAKRRITHRINKMFRGVDQRFVENFGHDPERLAKLLNEWRQKYADAP
jgi:hypothetical protein